MREYNSLKRQLERETAALDRLTNSAEAQLSSAMSAVQKELDTDAGENTMEVEPSKPEAPAAQQAAPEQK